MNKQKLLIPFLFAPFVFNVQADTLTELQKCAQTKDSLVRLVCYDNIVKALNTGVKSSVPATNIQTNELTAAPQVTAPSKADIAVASQAVIVKQPQSSEEAFGQEHLNKEERKQDNSVDEVTFTIKSLSKTARKNWLITFENGQVWKQADNAYLKLSPGISVELSKGALGVVYLKKQSQNKRIRVKRQK